MNKLTLLLCLIVIMPFFSQNTFSQSSVVPNTPGAAWNYLGWTLGTNAPVLIKNEDALPINFYTASGFQTILNQRMTIFDATGSPNAGFVGIGLNLTAPQSQLHLDNFKLGSAASIYTQWTNFTTGNTAPTLGLRIGIDNLGDAQIRQEQANLPIQFMINSAD